MTKVLTKREKIVLYMTVSIFLSAIAFNLLVVPVINRNEALNKEITITRAKLQRYLLLLSQKERIKKEFDKKFASFSGQNDDSSLTALAELQNLTRNAGIRIIDLRPENASKNSSLYKEALIDLRVEGDVEGYLKFIYSLENSPFLLKIKSFQLNSRPNAPALEGIFSISQVSLN